MDRQPPSFLSQSRPIRRPLYGRVGSIPPGGVTLVQSSPVVASEPPPVVATAQPPARVSSPPATQLPPTSRSAREMTPPGTQMPPARSQVLRSESMAPPSTTAPPSGASAAPAASEGSPQQSTPESPVTIKADTVTRPPTPATSSRSSIAHPVPEPNPPAAEQNRPSANGSTIGNGGAAGRGLSRRFSAASHTPTPPSPRSGTAEEIKKSFPEEKPDTKNSSGSVTGEKSSVGSASKLGGFGMLTLAGENTGAYMELAKGGQDWRGDAVDSRGRSLNVAAGKPHRIPADQGVWAQRRGTSSETKNGDGNSRKEMEEQSQSGILYRTRPMSALVNSNVQGVNNSILCQSTFSHGSPGVHVAFSRGNSNRHRRHNGVGHPAAASTAGS